MASDLPLEPASQAELTPCLCYVPRMHMRKSLLIIGQFFLMLAFVCAPVADQLHSVRMLQSGYPGQASTETTSLIAASESQTRADTPCHEAIAADIDTTVPADTQTNARPCCPDKQCSPNHCPMQFAIAVMPPLEVLPHSLIDADIFLDTEFQLVSVPFTERLRPPIA